MDGLAGAIFTAALALAGKVAFDFWERHRQRSSIAAALAGEIGAYFTLLNPRITATNYRTLASMAYEMRCARLRSMGKLPSGHPVFDKVADKVGLLPTTEAFDVSKTYNIITGLRILVSDLSSDEIVSADSAAQQGRLLVIADILTEHHQPMCDLVTRLKQIAERPFINFIHVRFVGS